MKHRAYSTLEIKGIEDDARVIRGIASTPSPDRDQDIMVPLGAKFALPLPLLWQHDPRQPIGHVTEAKVTSKGIEIVATIVQGVTDEIERAWAMIKSGLVRGLSIGFKGLEDEAIPGTFGRKFTSWEWLELSAVTVPANAEASILTVKQFANEQAASGQSSSPAPVGASAAPPSNTRAKAMTKKTYAEQISAFEATRAAKAARMTELMDASADSGETLDAAGVEEYDGLQAEVKGIDAHLVRLRDAERTAVQNGTDVTGAKGTTAGQLRASVAVVKAAPVLPKGTAFTRYAMALMAGKGNLMQSAEIAKRWGDSTPEVETVLKAAVAAGTTTDAAWAKPLVEYQNMASEFAELLRPATILGRIQGLRRVPFNIKVPRQTGGSSASWVGEGAPKPVSALAFDQISLGHMKLAGIVVMTDELVRFSNPAAEDIVRRDLVDTIGQTIDRDFVDPANAGTTDVKPASITNGVTPIVASGTDADALRADAKAVMSKFVEANMSLSGSVWIMTETQALSIALMLNPLGQPEFPGIQINGDSGGTFMGLPVVLSENIPAQAAVTGPPAIPAGSRIILAKATEILLADDGEVVLDASNQASLQMDSAPTNPPVAATVMVSLWQMNMVGIRAERHINWTKRRPGAVQFITGTAYA